MMKRFGLALVVVFIGSTWFFPSGAQAATYYIAPSGGSDTISSGTLEQPFATFSYAIGHLDQGDTLYVRGGTYNLSSTISISSSKNGTAALPYAMMAYNSELPVLDFTAEASGSGACSLTAVIGISRG